MSSKIFQLVYASHLDQPTVLKEFDTEEQARESLKDWLAGCQDLDYICNHFIVEKDC